MVTVTFFSVQSKTKNVFCPHFTVCIFPVMLKNCWIWFHVFAETQQRHRGDETLHQSVAERCEHRVREPWLDNYCNLSAIFKWRQQQQFQTPFKEWHFYGPVCKICLLWSLTHGIKRCELMWDHWGTFFLLLNSLDWWHSKVTITLYLCLRASILNLWEQMQCIITLNKIRI